MQIKKASHRAATLSAGSGGPFSQEVAMSKTAVAAITSLLVVASPFAYAQNAPATQTISSATGAGMLTDVRIHVIKAALQLTPEQEQYWPAVEQAIRSRAQDREARVAKISERLDNLQESSAAELVSKRDPIAFLSQRADALAQRSASHKKLAAAWEPLYRTLDQDQKRRMRFVTLVMLTRAVRGVRSSMQDDEDSDGF
jgi:hypothetical protein